MMAGGGLPGAYRRGEYLESTGTQDIVTNYVPTADETATEFVYQYTIQRSADDMIYGVSNGSVLYYAEEYASNRWYAAIGLSRYSNIRWTGYSSNLYKTKAILGLETLDITNLETGVTRTGNPNGSYTSFENQLPMYIFAWNRKGKAEYIHLGLRMFDFKTYRANVLSAHFIPCVRISDSKPGMYDTVSRTFYTNAGTGEFIVPN